MGAIDSRGYGTFGYSRESGKRQQVKAHRFAYRLCVGKIPRDLLICHKCDVTLCCNPHHLFLGTADDNSKDMVSKNRQARLKGEAHGGARLSESEVRTIRKLRKQGYDLQSIAVMYRVSDVHVGKICLGTRWKHL
jgi:DUF1365 family protein